MTKAEIIDETVAYYSRDVRRRGLDLRRSCVYLTGAGNRCAVGRCLRKPVLSWADKHGNAADLLDASWAHGYEEADEIFLPRYQGHEVAFWVDLQGLHDGGRNWSDDGLSEGGRARLATLKAKWCDS
jgi:hypothetical protein